MAEEKPAFHVDSDWKKQAQEEKKRLAEQEAARQKSAAAAPAGVVSSAAAPAAGPASSGAGRSAGRGRREADVPPASLATLVQSLTMQVLFHLGEIAQRGAEPAVNLDMAKHNVDALGVLEEKTKGNLTPEEKKMLDSSLYESRMRFIAVASRHAELP